MNVRLLVDGLVRQTTVLIAQLSTTAGVRAPLAHVADQVFLDLSREIEGQGIGRKVAADMFGMALRSYQKKVQRLTASVTDSNQTLWQAVLEFLRDGSKSRARIDTRFAYDQARDVGAVLNDLVASGLVYCTGKAESAIYGLTSEADLHAVATDRDLRSVANVVWLHAFLGEGRTEADFAARLMIPPHVVSKAVTLLLQEGRLKGGPDGKLLATDVVIPVGATEGWEAAVLDHFRAVASVIATKAATGKASAETDEVGGATLTFSLYPGHPQEKAVRTLLSSVRAQANALWQAVTAHAAERPPSDDDFKVTFYFGQTIQEADDELIPSAAADSGTTSAP
jgi:hypothetical protein